MGKVTKFAIVGVSDKPRTPQEVIEIDGYTLKPESGKYIFLYNKKSEVFVFGTNYNASTGGCIVSGKTYSSTEDLYRDDLYIVDDVVRLFDNNNLSNIVETKVPSMIFAPNPRFVAYINLIGCEIGGINNFLLYADKELTSPLTALPLRTYSIQECYKADDDNFEDNIFPHIGKFFKVNVNDTNNYIIGSTSSAIEGYGNAFKVVFSTLSKFIKLVPSTKNVSADSIGSACSYTKGTSNTEYSIAFTFNCTADDPVENHYTKVIAYDDSGKVVDNIILTTKPNSETQLYVKNLNNFPVTVSYINALVPSRTRIYIDPTGEDKTVTANSEYALYPNYPSTSFGRISTNTIFHLDSGYKIYNNSINRAYKVDGSLVDIPDNTFRIYGNYSYRLEFISNVSITFSYIELEIPWDNYILEE